MDPKHFEFIANILYIGTQPVVCKFNIENLVF